MYRTRYTRRLTLAGLILLATLATGRPWRGTAHAAASGKPKEKAMATIKPNYIEISVGEMAETKAFYSRALGFEFTDYGPDYAAVEQGACQLGFVAGEKPAAPLPAFESDDLETSLAAVEAAGGSIHVPIFAYPGGRRFEFTDPAGNAIAIYQPSPA